MRFAFAFFVFFGFAQIAIAEPFGLRITIPNSSLPSGDLNARLQYALERSSDDFVPISDGMTLKNDQRNEYQQFVFRFDRLDFTGIASRGFFWGEVKDASGKIVRRIPMTAFYKEALNDRKLVVLTVAARPIGLGALAASYPIHLPDKNFLDENNVLFSLQAVRTLIDEGFVTSSSEWRRIFDKFTANVGFFQRGGAKDAGRILRYLHERYEILAGTDASIEAYSNFYLRFLSELSELKIGGLAAPDSTTLSKYTLNRQRQIIGEQGVAVLNEVMETQADLIKQRNPVPCIRLSEAMLVEMNADDKLWSEITNQPALERSVKIFLKRLVDCAQRHYVDNGPDDSSIGALKPGFAFLIGDQLFGEKVISGFSLAVQRLEERGLFLQRNRTRTFRQVYVYYDEYLEREGQ